MTWEKVLARSRDEVAGGTKKRKQRRLGQKSEVTKEKKKEFSRTTEGGNVEAAPNEDAGVLGCAATAR